MFTFYCKKLLRCPAVYAGALLFVLSIYFSVYDTLDALNPTYLYEYSTGLGVSWFLIPVVTVLPVCFVQRELSRGSAWQLPLLRTSPARFTLGGLSAACLSGAAVTTLAFVVFFLSIVVIAGPRLMLDYTLGFFQDKSYLETTLLELLFLALQSMLHPAVSFLVSGYTSNQYLCAAAPFLLQTLARYGFGALVYYGGLRFFVYLDPGHLDPGGNPFVDAGWHVFLLYVLGYVLSVVAVCGLLYRRRLERRLQNG